MKQKLINALLWLGIILSSAVIVLSVYKMVVYNI